MTMKVMAGGLAFLSCYLISTLLFLALYAAGTLSQAFPLGRVAVDFGQNPITYATVLLTVTYYLAAQVPLIFIGLIVSHLRFFTHLSLWLRLVFWPLVVALDSVFVNASSWPGIINGVSSMSLETNEALAAGGLWWAVWLLKELNKVYLKLWVNKG